MEEETKRRAHEILSRCYTLTPLGARKLFDQRVREWKHEGKKHKRGRNGSVRDFFSLCARVFACNFSIFFVVREKRRVFPVQACVTFHRVLKLCLVIKDV